MDIYQLDYILHDPEESERLDVLGKRSPPCRAAWHGGKPPKRP